jgi:glycerol dehydrogenase-like iron-containing ADH family enzyme
MTAAPQQHAIAPTCVLRGPGAWRDALGRIPQLCQRPLLLGRSAATADLRRSLAADLEAIGLRPLAAQLLHDCCEEDLQALEQSARTSGCDAVIAAGGGKVLDAG